MRAVAREPYAPRVPGRAIVIAAWATNILFLITAVPAAAGVDAFDGPAVGMAVGLFLVSLIVWPWALGRAFVRSAEGDDIVVASMFLTMGDAPRSVRWHLFGALTVCLAIAAATAADNPFGVLVPMLPLGLIGLWGARHGTFPPRPASASRAR
jgi:hypothetical protein